MRLPCAFPSVGNGANGSVTLENLTVADNRATSGGAGGGIMASPILTGSTVTIRNSLIVNNSNSDISTAAAGTVNQVSNLTGSFSGFVNAGSRDYHLTAGATTAIDHGNTGVVTSSTDLDRTARIKNGTVDLGAYEFGVTNSAPTLANALPDRSATEDQAFSFQFAANTFADADNDTLTYSATLAGGGALPAWLSFTAATRTFSGTPANGNVGSITVRVTATDPSNTSASDDFVITVANVNDTPTVANVIPDQNATEDQAFSFQFATNTFADVDAGDTLSYSATLAGGGELPAWLSFNAATRTFSGTPANGDVGSFTVRVTATDGSNTAATNDFDIAVANVNDTPTVANVIPDQGATEDQAFSFQFAANTFADVDAGDTLSYSATLAGGGALPGWLSFNATTRTFSGTPANSDVGIFTVRVTATDSGQATASVGFTLSVANTNDAPVPGSDAIETDMETPIVFDVLGNDIDVDAGDVPSVIAVGQPAHGTVVIETDGRLRYEPEFGFTGVDEFRYTVADRDGTTGVGSVRVTVLETRSPLPVTTPLLPVAEAPPPAGVGLVDTPNLVLTAVNDGGNGGTGTGTGTGETVRMATNGGGDLSVRPPTPGVGPETVRQALYARGTNGYVPPALWFGTASGTGTPLFADLGFRPPVGPQDGGPALPPVVLHAGAGFDVALPPVAVGTVREVRLRDGSALPAWLHFDPASGRLDGRVPPGERGFIELRIRERAADGTLRERVLRLELEAVPAAGAAPADAPPVAGLSGQLQQIGGRFDAGRAALIARLAALG